MISDVHLRVYTAFGISSVSAAREALLKREETSTHVIPKQLYR